MVGEAEVVAQGPQDSLACIWTKAAPIGYVPFTTSLTVFTIFINVVHAGDFTEGLLKSTSTGSQEKTQTLEFDAGVSIAVSSTWPNTHILERGVARNWHATMIKYRRFHCCKHDLLQQSPLKWATQATELYNILQKGARCWRTRCCEHKLV